MNIIISNTSEVPIYEQIKNQLKNMIISGELAENKLLPGMRSLAKDLKVSVITTKRAYNDLETEGFIYTVPGKGSFVKSLNSDLIKEKSLSKIEELLSDAIVVAEGGGIDLDELIEILETLWR
ncbi:GntR family transcriptional regulator [Peptoniphilus catoniae]|uniref:GntR family transcriptional regulator n=1 Tax=Peptoniphilus catoniae TaxID=1660341 RepID=UPI0010FDE28C|nr:GntR family transcriptional regulator [Peptoniphilus catoniae]